MSRSTYRNQIELVVGVYGSPEARKITGLAIGVKVEVGAAGRASSAEVVAYNLSDTSRAALAEADAVVSIDAIRDGVRSQLFVGTVSDLRSEVSGRDASTSFSLDSGREGLSRRVSMSYGPGASVRNICDELARAAGLPLAAFGASLSASAVGDGWAHLGTVAEGLRGICATAGAQWRVIGGGVHVEPIGGEIVEMGPRFAPGSGLIGSPRNSEKGRVEVVVELDSTVVPGTYYEVSSRLVNAAFRAREVTHEAAANMSGGWTTTILGDPL